MKLEVGMYVRTRYGYIAKLKKINKTDRYTEYEFDNKIGYDYDGFFHSIVEDCIDDIEIIQASHNIIDLIEVGDIVTIINGMRKEELILIKDLDKEIHILNTHKIVSIVTKEQFESMSYKVGDKQ